MRHKYPGYFSACVGMFGFACLYAFYKLAGEGEAPVTVVFYQSLWSLLLLLPLCWGKSLATSKLGRIAFRSLLGFGVAWSMTWALKTIPVAEATLLNNVSPLLVPLIAWAWLKEKIARGLWPCLALGFVGILVILHPGTDLWRGGAVIALVSGVLSAALVIAARKIAHEPLHTVLFYYTLFACLAASPSIVEHPQLPSFYTLFLTGMAGIAMLVAQFFFTFSLRYLSPQHIAPLIYLIVPFSGLLDWLFWHVVPSPFLLLGMVLIMVAGLISLKLKKWALILVNPLASGEPFKALAQELGYKVIAIYPNTEEIYTKYHGTRESLEKNCDVVFFSSDIDTLVQSLRALPFSIQGCIPALEIGVSVAMKLADRLHLIGNPIEMLPYYRDKGFMRKRLREFSLSCPDFSVCRLESEVVAFASVHEFPLVIKTPRGAASEQVFICATKQQLLAHFQEICGHVDPFGEQAKEAVVEEFLDGTEYIVDLFADGKTLHVTDVWFYDKISVHDLKNIYYNTISVPLDDPIVEKLSAAALRLGSAFQIQKGAAHFEIKDDSKRGPTLIEINARLPGAGISALIQESSDWNPFLSTIEVFTKGKTRLPKNMKMKHMAIVMCPLKESGTVAKVEGMEQIENLPSYMRHSLHVHPGDRVSYTQDLLQLPCMIYLAHTNRAQLLQDVEQAHKLFRVVLVRD